MRTRLVALHASGRFDRDDTKATAITYTADLARWIKATGAVLLTVTECGDPDRWSGVAALPGWKAYRNPAGHGANECGQAWDPKHATAVETRTDKLTDHTYFHAKPRADGSPNPTDPVTACTVVYRFPDGAHLIQSVVHTPSHIEAAKGWGNLIRRVRAYRSAMRGWRALFHELEAKYPGAATRATADFNLNIKRPLWRSYFARTWGKSWRVSANLRGPGDLGKRLISFSLLHGPVVTAAPADVLPAGKSSDHRPVVETLALITAPKEPPVDPYARTTHGGKVVDCLTDAALDEAEKRLGYPLTIIQGSYNAGAVSASAGTHDGGGAVDLTPWDWQKKVHVMRAVGFAAWHRTAIPGVWSEHVHCILISDEKASPAAKAQVVDYRNHRDGLADNAPDNTWHPTPIPEFTLPKTYRPKENA